MKPILLATDGSPTALEATEVAMQLASDSGRPLSVVSVFDVSSSSVGYGFVPALPDWSQVLKEHAAEVLDDVREAAATKGLEVETMMLQGFPADEICRLAEEQNAELIVIGSHGWGPVRRLLFGSVSDSVLHHAPCPVLVVRGSARETARPAVEHEKAAVC
jgi:nucleotide-binding universal stress UspA family protein